MTAFFRKLVPLATVVLLSGCTLKPMLAEPTPDAMPQKFILKVSGSGKGAYHLRRELEKQLRTIPKQSETPYTVSVSYTESSNSLSFAQDATVIRSQAIAKGDFKVMQGAEEIGKGNSQSISSYSLNYAEVYSSNSALAAAQNRARIVLAEDLTREVLMALKAPKKLLEEKSEDGK